MKYKFTCDFPPTRWKKEDSFEKTLDFSTKEIAFLLHLGILEDVNKKWELKKYEKYWYVNECGITDWTIWEDDDIDNKRLAFHNVFPTESLALEAKERWLKANKGE